MVSSPLASVHVSFVHVFFYQYVCSLRIKPTTLATATISCSLQHKTTENFRHLFAVDEIYHVMDLVDDGLEAAHTVCVSFGQNYGRWSELCKMLN